jgi:hypothetical protein
MKKRPKYNQNSIIRGALRRAFARSPVVQEKMAESRREIPKYRKDGSRAKKNWVQRQCEVCLQWAGSTKLSVDHVDPVISVDEGFQDWNVFISRLWCNKSNLQRICDTCHNFKTGAERVARLIKQYSAELDEYERIFKLSDGLRNTVGASTDGYKILVKAMNRYIAKKKTKGLEQIVKRARELKEKFLDTKRRYDE